METLRTSMSMALILSEPIAVRCCKMPARMASFSLTCFLQALAPKSAAVNPMARAKRFKRGPSYAKMLATISSTRSRCSQPIRNQRQIIEADPCCVKSGVAHCGSNCHDGRLPGARGWNVLAIEKNRLNLWHIAEARHAVRRKVGVLDVPILEFD